MGQTTTATGWSWVREISRYQWMVFLVVWLGWTLDATDFSLFALVLRPALTELLGGNPVLADIGRFGGLLSMIGLLGWALRRIFFRHRRPTISAASARWRSASYRRDLHRVAGLFARHLACSASTASSPASAPAPN